MYIARLWHGTCPVASSDSFLRFLEVEISRFKGCVGTFVNPVVKEKTCHIFVCTFWPSIEVLKAFVGESLVVPIEDPEDEKHGVISDPIVTHFETPGIQSPFETSWAYEVKLERSELCDIGLVHLTSSLSMGEAIVTS